MIKIQKYCIFIREKSGKMQDTIELSGVLWYSYIWIILCSEEEKC